MCALTKFQLTQCKVQSGMSKVWSYGDSHAAGHELGNWWSSSVGRDWIQNEYGLPNRERLQRSLGPDKYRNVVKEIWYEHLEDTTGRCRPEFSYAGELARLMLYDLVDRAAPGNSNSQSIDAMYQDYLQWKRDDIVLFSVVTSRRFMPASDRYKRNHQAHWLEPDDADTMMQHGPHDIDYKLQTQAYIKLAESMHPNMITLQTTDEDLSHHNIGPLFTIRDNFTTWIYENWDEHFRHLGGGPEDGRYPGGHFHEDCHALYAKHIYETLI